YEPTYEDAKNRVALAPRLYPQNTPQNMVMDFPITLTNDGWNDFMGVRYDQRAKNLAAIMALYSGKVVDGVYEEQYYNKIAKFIRDASGTYRPNYVRIAGNHDTYLDEDHEKDLLGDIQKQLWTASGINSTDRRINDVVTVLRDGSIKYVITHGHQFDPASLQHGTIPCAKSLGEVDSECLSWPVQGPERFWNMS